MSLRKVTKKLTPAKIKNTKAATLAESLPLYLLLKFLLPKSNRAFMISDRKMLNTG